MSFRRGVATVVDIIISGLRTQSPKHFSDASELLADIEHHQ